MSGGPAQTREDDEIPLLVSIVIPAHGAPRDLERALAAARSASSSRSEILVVDDGSTPPLEGRTDLSGARVIRIDRRGGPAAARNAGARAARGEILFFVDADVVVRPDAVLRVTRDLAEHPDHCAVFGSYDAAPAQRDFLSQYKNLLHHFVHQTSDEEAGTFWAGCGAIRKSAFLEAGGFDAVRYAEPSIEDIELGVRLRRAGRRILLDKSLQATHLKKWGLRTLLVTDIARRAVPWTRLILEEENVPSDLNLKGHHRASAALCGLLVLFVALSLAKPALLAAAAVCLAGIVVLNRDLYGFFARARGPLFAAGVVPMHVLYYLYSGAVFAALTVLHHAGLLRGHRPPAAAGAARKP